MLISSFVLVNVVFIVFWLNGLIVEKFNICVLIFFNFNFFFVLSVICIILLVVKIDILFFFLRVLVFLI